jgi:DNA polymerase III sliding clamp (beta) subunit (PCNA family)
LQAIQVEPNQTVATDGTRLMIVTCPNRDADLKNFPVVDGFRTRRLSNPILVDIETAKQVSKNMPKKQHIPILNNAAVLETGNDHIGFISTDLKQAKPVISRKLKNATFPRYQHAFPEGEPTMTVGFNAKLLGELMSFFAKFGDDRYPTVKFSLYGADKVMKMEISNSETGQDATALLMPVSI